MPGCLTGEAMYQPEHFKLEDLGALHGVIRAHPLAQIVTAGPGGLMANAAPFILHAEEGDRGVLRTHLARPNPQWREIEAGADLLLIFQGGQAYVTPSWYASEARARQGRAHLELRRGAGQGPRRDAA